MLWCSVALLALFASVQGRAVNISNTWVLPEEGFPVFYRYFRDRISWYEADAVCQFHHANLVTVDTTAQYDAVRAYLKELDISSAVWVGLIRSNPDGDFTWTDYRGLSGEGYWSSAPDPRAAPLCAAANPAADYRWEARACGGPTVASFICELPVPQWALGNEGCMVRALPALTILYLPESAAVQLTADCGLAGVKRVQCTGNVKRDDLLRDLSCNEEEEITTSVSLASSSSSTWPITTDATSADQDTTTETTTEENATTEHEDDINQSSSTIPSTTTNNIKLATEYQMPPKLISINKFNRISNILDKNLDLALAHNNNLQSNYIPKIANGDNSLSNEQLDKIEDEKHMQHKMLHEEIARLGNLENIFTQPTDHFVPPLVMAKAKISDDMTVLSLQEKHAQQVAEQHLYKQNMQFRQNDHPYESSIIKSTTEEPKLESIDKIFFAQTMVSKDNMKKEKVKFGVPKKYNDKINEPKSKLQKPIEIKPLLIEKTTELTSTQTESVTKRIDTTPLPLSGRVNDEDDSALDLTVLLKDAPEVHEEKMFYNYSGDISRLEAVKNSTMNNETEIRFYDVEATEEIKQENPTTHFEEKIQNITLNNEVVKITIISEGHTTLSPTTFEITTKVPQVQDSTPINALSSVTKNNIADISATTTEVIMDTTKLSLDSVPVVNVSRDPIIPISKVVTAETIETVSTTIKSPIISTELSTISTTISNNNTNVQNKVVKETTTSVDSYISHEENEDHFNIETHEEFGANNNNSKDILDDLNSPLLSGANEPLPRPNRSRRPQPPPNRNKFNPFRILG